MNKSKEIYCNMCGRRIQAEQEIVQEDTIRIEKIWGYFSDKDGEKHSLNLCEECYDKWIKGFAIPPEVSEENELI